jgi:hypothetical protein
MGIQTELLALSEWVIGRTRTRLEGLTDHELRWPPAPGSWTVRRLADGRVVVDDREAPGPDVPPPSIAWRIAHLIDVYASSRNARWLRSPVATPFPGRPWTIGWTAAECVELLDRATAHWLEVLRSVDDERYWELLGPGTEPYAEATLVAFVHHQLDEAIHHSAEVGVLRDLYRWRADGGEVLAEPATVWEAGDLGRWDVVERLVLAGERTDPPGGGRSALHQAAAVGDLAMVRLLVEHGADLSAKDPDWNGTPLVWANYLGRTEVADYLRAARSMP